MKLDKGKILYFSYAISLLLFILFALILIPYYATKHFEDQVTLLDVRIWYSSAEVVELFNILGDSGRTSYANFLLYIDMLYPLVYGFFLLLTSHLIIRKLNWKRFLQKTIMIFPIGVMLFDYFENIFILILLKSFPIISSTIVFVASASTFLKWLFLFICLLLVFIAMLNLTKRYFFKLTNS